MKRTLAILAALLSSSAACAQDVTVKPTLDARLRYEHVDQDGIALPADALTLRLRPGVEAKSGGWSVLVEGEATLAIVEDYNSGTNGRSGYPLVVDPANLELNRAHIRYTGADGLGVTLGRQRIELADQRFVGSAPFRQNEQTFDAVRFQWGKPLGFSADLTYSWNNLTVNGRDGTGARQQAVGGDNVFALLGYAAKPGKLTAFAYLVDQDEAAVQGYRLSSQTYGLRFAGTTPVAPGVTLGYTASVARQSDWHRNPNNYAATYWLGEATLATKGLTLTGGYEVLGASNGAAFTSVQTPLASFFKWQGWTGKFNPTPPNGLRDAYAGAGYGWKKVGPFDAITLSAAYHDFTSDRLSLHYGSEIDMSASLKRGHYTLTARYGRYRADAFATDTDKFWLQFDWTL
ncbi:alginate export family protein [Sphingomonas sp. AOB5]|uniref:alginate export family protein n=1 Tax=Sphingomonas sp. AOB5 TaxID=3034017 RepID=UPI0023FA2BE4|nr:alginate export family protein [Sphingomonas sp. AOB5]MDF7776368.1 alginate export family protein [Sphingomonas sp. AOB5]